MHTLPPLLFFFFSFLFFVLGFQHLSSYLRSYPPFHTGGGGNLCVCVSVVYLSSCETLAKLSVLSANFTTCVKLKAVMWKRCLPSFSLFSLVLSPPLSPSIHSSLPSFFVYFPHPIYPTLCLSLSLPLCIIHLLKSVWSRQRGSGVLDAHEWGDLLRGWLRLLSAVHMGGRRLHCRHFCRLYRLQAGDCLLIKLWIYVHMNSYTMHTSCMGPSNKQISSGHII